MNLNNSTPPRMGEKKEEKKVKTEILSARECLQADAIHQAVHCPESDERQPPNM